MSMLHSPHLGIFMLVLRRMFSSRAGGLLNILVIGITLSLPAGLYLLLQNTQTLVAQLSGTPQVSLFLSMNAQKKDVDQLRKRLESHAAISTVEFVSRDAALEQLKQSTGMSGIIGTLEKNPLPDAFIVTPKTIPPGELEALRVELGKLDGVEQAQLDSAWAYKLEALLRFGRIGVLILASLLSLALVAVTFNTIRLQILTQRDEIEISRLIGATDAFIRRPFLYFGALQGLLGGLAAWLIIISSLALLNRPLSELTQLYGSGFRLLPLSLGDTLSLLFFSLYLGWLGAWLSVSRHLSLLTSR